MATFVVTSTVNNYRSLPTSEPQRITEAVWPTGVAITADARKSQQTLLGEPTFIVRGTTDTNTADSDAINLSAQGVTFPANTVREIRVVAYAGDGTAVSKVTAAALVIGGTTPAFSGEGQDVASVGAVTSDSVTTASFGAAPVVTIDFEVVSNEVIVEAVGESGDVVTWHIEVYVGRLIPMTLV